MEGTLDAVLLLGHGSRVAAANLPLGEVAAMLSAAMGGVKVKPAFLQLAEPSLGAALEELYEGGARKVAIMPFFLFPGAHVLEDIPEELEKARQKHPDFELVMSSHIGAHPKLAEIALERIKESVS